MGKCISSENSKRRSFKQGNTYYKPKLNSSSLVACRVYEKSFKDIQLKSNITFETGSIFRKIDSLRYICIGGVNNGESSFIINLLTKTIEKIPNPPMPLSYGNAINVNFVIYVIGSLVIEASGQEKPAPPLSYNFYSKKWSELPPIPVKLALCGSFCLDSDIYLLGGYLNYPESPSHFREIIIYKTLKGTWIRSNITTPIFQGIPACCEGKGQVFIIGGHDPCEKMTDEESRKTYLFDLSSFLPLTDVPLVGQGRFVDEPVYYESQIFLYSDDDIMFIYNIKGQDWGYIDYDQSTLSNKEDSQIYKTIRTYIYRYIPQDCDIVEYNITFKTKRRTGPSSFKYSFNYTGMFLMEEGKLLFAGGIDDNNIPQKSTWTLVPKIGSAVNTADLPTPQYGLKMTQYQGAVYTIAGVTDQNSLLENFCQKFLPSENRWMTLPPMPITVFLPAVCVFKSKIFAFAGKTRDENCWYIQTLNLINEDWEILDLEYPCPAFGLACGLIDSGVLCFGGQDLDGNNIPDSYLFSNGELEPVENLPCDSDDNCLFLDPCVVSLGKLFAVNTEGTVYSYFNSWEVVFS